MAQNFLAGVQVGASLVEQAQRRRLLEQQAAQEMAMLPLRQTLAQQESEFNKWKLQDYLTTRQAMVDTEADLANLSSLVSQKIRAGKVEETTADLLDAVARNGKLRMNPGFQALAKDVGSSLAAKIELAQSRGHQFKPETGTLPHPITKEPIPFIRTGTGSIDVLEPKQLSVPSDVQTARIITELERKIAATTDATEKAELERELFNVRQQTIQPGMTVRFDEAGKPVVTMGGKGQAEPGAPTVATQTRLQESLQSSVNTVDIVNRLEPLISNETVGVKAFVENIALDKLLAQAFPEVASQKRADAKVLAAQLRASATKELKSDGNISDKERAQILQAVPQINDPIDSPINALRTIRSTRKLSALRAIVTAQKLGQAIPTVAARALQDSDLIEAADMGLISKEAAKAAYYLKRQQ